MRQIENIIAERADTHGDYKTQAALAQTIKRMLRNTRNWERLEYHQAQSLEAMCDKIARILCGKFSEQDHWSDIAGYAQLVVFELSHQATRHEIPNAKSRVVMPPKIGDEPLDPPSFLQRAMEELNAEDPKAKEKRS